MDLSIVPKKIRSIIRINDLEDYCVLFNPLTAETKGLNPAGELIWETLDGCVSVKGLSEVLQSTFSIDTETAERDTIELIAKLHRRMFIEIPGLDVPEAEEGE